MLGISQCLSALPDQSVQLHYTCKDKQTFQHIFTPFLGHLSLNLHLQKRSRGFPRLLPGQLLISAAQSVKQLHPGKYHQAGHSSTHSITLFHRAMSGLNLHFQKKEAVVSHDFL